MNGEGDDNEEEEDNDDEEEEEEEADESVDDGNDVNGFQKNGSLTSLQTPKMYWQIQSFRNAAQKRLVH